jgi:hypothetical protein
VSCNPGALHRDLTESVGEPTRMSQAQTEKMTNVCADECCAPPAFCLPSPLPSSGMRSGWNG